MSRRLFSDTSIDRPALLSLALATLLCGAMACGGDSDDNGATDCESDDDCIAEATCSGGTCMDADATGDVSDADNDVDGDVDSDVDTDADNDANTDVNTDPDPDTDASLDTGADADSDAATDGGDDVDPDIDVGDDATDTGDDVDPDAADVAMDTVMLLANGDVCDAGDECESGVCANARGRNTTVCASDDQVCVFDHGDGPIETEDGGVSCQDAQTQLSCSAGQWLEATCEGVTMCGVAGCQICPVDATECVQAVDNSGLDIDRVSVGVLDGGGDVSTAAIVLDIDPGTESRVVSFPWALDSDAFGELVYVTNQGDAETSTDGGARSRVAVSGTGSEATAVVSWMYRGDANIRMLDASGAPVVGSEILNYFPLDPSVALQDATIGPVTNVVGVTSATAVPGTGGGYSSSVFSSQHLPDSDSARLGSSGWPSAPYYLELDIAPVQGVYATAIRTTRDTLDVVCSIGTSNSNVSITSALSARAGEDSVQLFGAPGQNAILLWVNIDNELVATQVTHDEVDGCAWVSSDVVASGFTRARYEGSMWSDGSYVVSYVDDTGEADLLMAARYAADGTAMGDPETVALSGLVPDTAFGVSTYGAGVSRRFVVAWTAAGVLYGRSM